METKRLVTDALCAALYVILATFLGLSLGPIQLSLDVLPIILGAMLFGPVDGMIIGLLGNFISQLLGPYGLSVTTVLWMIPSGVVGLIVGWYANRKSYLINVKQIAFIILIALFADTTVTTGAMWVDCLVYKYSFVTYGPYIVWRYVADVIKTAVCTVIVPGLTHVLRKATA